MNLDPAVKYHIYLYAIGLYKQTDYVNDISIIIDYFVNKKYGTTSITSKSTESSVIEVLISIVADLLSEERKNDIIKNFSSSLSMDNKEDSYNTHTIKCLLSIIKDETDIQCGLKPNFNMLPQSLSDDDTLDSNYKNN